MVLPGIHVIRFERAAVNLCHFSLLWFTVAYIADTQIITEPEPTCKMWWWKHIYKLQTHAPTIIHVNFDRKTCHNKFTFSGIGAACVWNFRWGPNYHRCDCGATSPKTLNNYGENMCSQTSTTNAVDCAETSSRYEYEPRANEQMSNQHNSVERFKNNFEWNIFGAKSSTVTEYFCFFVIVTYAFTRRQPARIMTSVVSIACAMCIRVLSIN